jgi:hypothetical protein
MNVVNVVAPAGLTVPTVAAGVPVKVAEPLPLPKRGSPIVYRARLIGDRGASPLHPLDAERFAQDLDRLTSKRSRHVRAIVRREDFSPEALESIILGLNDSRIVRLDLTIKA